jgi:hypothetical protein
VVYVWQHGAPRFADLCKFTNPDGPTAACFRYIHERGCPSPDCPHKAATEPSTKRDRK